MVCAFWARMRRLHVLPRLVPLFALGACLLPADLLGEEELVTEHISSSGAVDPLADDRIEDKHPTYDPNRTIDEVFDGCTVTLNKSAAVTKLDVAPLEGDDARFDKAIFPTYAAATAALGARPQLPSMEVVNARLKALNDGLYAAIELAVEDGTGGTSIAKRQLFDDLARTLSARATSAPQEEQAFAGSVAARFAAAQLLAGGTAEPSVESDARELVARFDTNLLVSTPIGFYTWNDALGRVFRRDRFLQAYMPFAEAAEVAVALGADAPLRDHYGRMLELYDGLTNPSRHFSPLALAEFVAGPAPLADPLALEARFAAANPSYGSPPCGAATALFPASDSPDTRLYRALTCATRDVFDGSFIDRLIDAIRTGRIDLTPTATSGFYDRQLYALETLLVPGRAREKDNLLLTRRYKQKLVESFQTLITETRETHAKQLETGASAMSGPPPEIDVFPLLRAEPFPTFYLRTARAYVFLEGVLRSALGPQFLDGTARLLEGGTRATRPIADELNETITLLYGLHLVTAASIGSHDEFSAEEAERFPRETCTLQANQWLGAFAADTDVQRDPRVLVPIAREDDEERNIHRIRYWAVIGVRVLRIDASYYEGYEPKLVRGCNLRSWLHYRPYILVGKSVEVLRSADRPPLTREAFRALCDHAGNDADALTRALESQ